MFGIFDSSEYSTMIDITIDEVFQQSMFRCNFHDKNDQCMKAIIGEEFKIADVGKSHHLNERNGLQAVFHLKNMREIGVNLISETGCPLDKIEDREFILTKCAAESILRKLYENKIIQNKTYLFQYRRRDSNVSEESACLRMVETASSEISVAKNDIISFINVYMRSHQLCIGFNKDKVSNKELAQIKTILSEALSPGLSCVIQ